MRIFNTVLFSLLSLTSLAQESATHRNVSIDKFQLEQILQAPITSLESFSQLRGKIIVLEFWATWCAPCIKQIPHLNALVNKFRDDSISFIAITYEDEKTVKKFLARTGIDGWVGLDLDKSIIKELAVKFYPTTIVIDKNGVVRERLMPNKLTEEKIEGYLGGVFSDHVVKSKSTKQVTKAPTGDVPIFEVSLSRSESSTEIGGFYNKKAGKLTLRAVPLRRLFSMAFDVPEILVFGDSAKLDKLFDAHVNLPGDAHVFEMVLQQALARVAGLNGRLADRKTEVYLLKKIENGGDYFQSSATGEGHASRDDGIIAASSYSISFLSGSIESVLGVPVIDSTGLNDIYNYQLFWDVNNSKSIIEALRDQLGLELDRAYKLLRVVDVIESVEKM